MNCTNNRKMVFGNQIDRESLPISIAIYLRKNAILILIQFIFFLSSSEPNGSDRLR